MLEKPNKWRPALIGGLVIGAVSGIPLISLVNCCCCAGILGGGVLAYYLYREEHTEGMEPLESSDALIIGIMAGVIGAFVQAAIHAFILLFFAGAQERLMRSIFEQLIDRLERSGSFPADALDQMRDSIENSMRESRSVGGFMVNLFVSVIVYPIFAMLGGLLGYGLFRSKKVAPPQVPPPPHP
ncbi:MAG TPA: hypothetical protein VMM37_07885 [Bacteroidota bacterium]|nr:hypothetical protein [Bacteroidota bacterium]